jgi:hypothetical protein
LLKKAERSDIHHSSIVNRQSSIVNRHSMKFHTSGAAGLKSGQFDRERNFGLVLQINVFILVLKSEYRIMNIECRISKEGILSILINLKDRAQRLYPS